MLMESWLGKKSHSVPATKWQWNLVGRPFGSRRFHQHTITPLPNFGCIVLFQRVWLKVGLECTFNCVALSLRRTFTTDVANQSRLLPTP